MNSRPETGKEGPGSGDLLKKVAPLAGVGVATLPFIFNKRKDKPIGRKIHPPKLRNGLFVPDAYLKYNFYDGEGVLLESDYMALDKNAKGNWQKLYLTKQVAQDGFVSIEMGNNSRRPVWFDQMKLTHSSRGQKMDAAGEPGKDLSLEGGDDVTTNKIICDLICVTTPYSTTCNSTDCYDDGTGPGYVDDPVEDCMLYYGDADFCDCYVFGQCNDGESPFNPPGGGGGAGPDYGNQPIDNQFLPEVIDGECNGYDKMLALQSEHNKEQVGLLTTTGEVIILPWDNNEKTLSSTYTKYYDADKKVILALYQEYGVWFVDLADYSSGSPRFTTYEVAAHIHSHPANGNENTPSPDDEDFASPGSEFGGMDSYYIINDHSIVEYDSNGVMGVFSIDEC
ncbi:MAG: hypothetical protein M3512_10345 [Bacteroidota bacterium]|nr:hypothetical protein [Bacteroidota bacterium]MDQ3536477.1 hypothetical protein [Bacteroidota bacterium]